jgi:hypothetical protein
MTHPGLPLAIALVAAPFVAVLQSKAMAPLALIPMAITLGLGWRAGWRPGLPQGAVLLLGLLLAAWGAITALWAPDPGRAALLAVFGAGTTTRTNLGAAVQRTVSRAEELGISAPSQADVTEARGL